jgi:hypothetical protein
MDGPQIDELKELVKVSLQQAGVLADRQQAVLLRRDAHHDREHDQHLDEGEALRARRAAVRQAG